MFQNIITSSPLVWAGLSALMVSLPILIHLINRLRHRRVRWAAMDFLMVSHRKNRKWVWLKQLLLLLTRIAVLLMILAAIGQVGCDNDSMSRFFGGKVTHHYVLVDDSLSMSDTFAGQTAMDRARRSLGMIASQIAGRNNHRITVIRFSRAEQMVLAADRSDSESEPESGNDELPLADINARVVDRDIERVVQEVAARMEPTSLATRPDAAISMIADLIERRSGENAVLYVLSDFRNKDWAGQQALTGSFANLATTDVAIEMIRCADIVNNNVAITALEPDGSVRVAGIPLMMKIQIRNFGTEPVRKLQVDLTAATYPESTDDMPIDLIEPQLDELSTILIDEIPGGETAVRRFPVFFSQPGQHAIRAALQPDSVSGDNTIWNVTGFATADRVLVIDGPGRQDGQFISLALSPGGMTGLQIEQGNKSLLRDATVEQLETYETIFLLDVDRLEESAVRNLREFVERGGGLVFFTGPNTNLKHYSTALYDSGQGVFPLPLEKTVSVPEQLDEQTADIAVIRHPIFAPVLDADNSPLDMVQVGRICQPPVDWSVDDDPSLNVIATVRGQTRQPLIVEKRLGKGTVLATLTSAGAQWNNWLRNPTFPATLLLMQDHVSRGRTQSRRALTGMVRVLDLVKSEYRPEVVFVSPSGNGFGRTSWAVDAQPVPETPETVRVRIGNSIDETSEPGIYESWLTSIQSGRELDRFALNIDNSESELQLVERADLLATTGDATVRIVDWDNFGPGGARDRGTSIVRLILILLLAGLVVEQWLAYSNSFHSRPRRDSRLPGTARSRNTRTSGKAAA